MENTQNKIWNTTLYLRLSRDDGDKEEYPISEGCCRASSAVAQSSAVGKSPSSVMTVGVARTLKDRIFSE